MNSVFIISALFAVVQVATCGFALWKGEAAERVGAGAMLIAWLATVNIHETTGSTGSLAVAAVDVILLAVLVALIIRTDRSWPVWSAAFHLLAMTSHIAYLLGVTQLPTGYMLALLAAAFGVVLSLAVGTFWVWQEREALRPLR